MATKKSTNTKSKAPAKAAAIANAGPTSLSSIIESIGTLVTSAVGTRLTDVLVDLKDRVSAKVTEDAPQVLEDAKKKVNKATEELFEWGKEHPVKTAAAAAALLAVSAFVYSTMHAHDSGSKSKPAKAARKAR